MAVRNEKGQFERGFSGNERGRPATERLSHRAPAKNRKAILDIAERTIEITIGGKKEELTLFQANVLRLGMDGAMGNRVSARQFAKLISETAVEDLQMKIATRQLAENIDQTQEAYERLRSKVEQRTGVIVAPYLWKTVSPEARADDGRMSLDDKEGLVSSPEE